MFAWACVEDDAALAASFRLGPRIRQRHHSDLMRLYTLDHQIGGFSQQQSYGGSLSFTSQHGLIDVASLPVISGDGQRSAAAQQAGAAPASSGSDVFATIERLADLHAKGILGTEEFLAKKAELLSRV